MKKLLFILLSILLFASCEKEEQQLKNTLKDAPVFTTSFEEYVFDDKTKTYVDENVKLLWHKEDELSVFTSTLNQKYLFAGETGDNSGTFSQVSTGGQFGTGNEIIRNYAVYPYSSSIKLSNSEVFTVTLPEVQAYAVNSFGRGANTMVAATSDLNDYFLPFKNVGGYLILKLYAEDVTVKSIYLAGNNGEKLSGKATITAEYGSFPVVEMAETATKTVKIDCGSQGVKLSTSKDEPTQFWFVIPPTTFEEGFTVTITDINDCTMTKRASKSFVIERNTVNSMSAIEVATESVPSNQIWYTTTDEEIVVLGTEDGFGASIESNVYEYGKGVITFSGSISAIPESAFAGCESLQTITIPEEVTSINSFAFKDCTNLTEVKIGEKRQEVSSDAVVSNLMQISKTQSQSSVIGAGAFSGCTGLTIVDIPKIITSICEGAFSGCSSLASINIPEGVITIEGEAFANCSSLTTLTVPKNVESIGDAIFSGCAGLKDIFFMPETPPASGTNIFGVNININITIHVPEDSFDAYLEDPVLGEYDEIIVGDADKVPSNQIWYTSTDGRIVTPDKQGVDIFGANIVSNTYEDGKGVIVFDGDVTMVGGFSKCTSLTSVNIPESVTTIDDYVFLDCSNLMSFEIPESVNDVGENPFIRCPNVVVEGKFISDDGRCLIKDGVVLSFLQRGDESIVYTTPQNVTAVGSFAFTHCEALTSITLSEGVTSIGNGAFNMCKNLTSAVLPEGVLSISTYAFNYCSSLTTINLPSTVTSIDEWAFARCMELKSVNVPAGVNNFGPNPFALSNKIKFSGDLASQDGRCLVKDGTLIAFSSGVDSTESVTFTIPEGVTAIGDDAFYKCVNLVSVNVPETVKSFGNFAFYKCSGISEITIPESVTTIGSSAFSGCSTLNMVTSKATSVPSIGSNAFNRIPSTSILKVPAGCVSTYGNSDWNQYFSSIVEIE